MEIWYANQYNPYFSEGYRSYLGHYESTWDPWTQTGEIIYVPLDMTAGQVGAIDLWWHGQSGNDNGEMYVALEDVDGNCVASTYSPADMEDPNWQVWRIELEDYEDGGIDLTEVNTIYVGVGDRFNPEQESVEGHLWIDQIAAFPPRCLPDSRPAGDITGDCKVDEKDLLVMSTDWLDCDFYEYIPVTEPCEANLIFLYTFETADGTDSGPHGLDAIRGGNAHVAVPTDPDRGDWVLELSTDWVDELIVPHDPLFELTQQITLAAWLKPDDTSGWRTVFGKFGGYKSIYIVFAYQRLFVALRDATPSSPSNTCMDCDYYDEHGHGSVVTDVWQHMAVTNDGYNVTLWVNGEYIFSTPTLGPMQLGTLPDEGDLYIGSNAPWSETFLGQMDDICMYDYGLDVSEILSTAGYEGSKETYLPLESEAELYAEEPQGGRAIDNNDFAIMAADWGLNQGFGGPIPELPDVPPIEPWAWWDFENQDATDRTSNEFHGTLMNGAEIVNDLERGWVLECNRNDEKHVLLPMDILLPDGTEKSVSFWVKPDVSQGWRGILCARNGSNFMSIGIADAGSAMSITAQLNTSQKFCFKNCWAVDEWKHICVTSTGVGDQTMYCDGVVMTDGWADNLGVAADGAALGHAPGRGWSKYFDGRLDDVRIYDWRLTVPEVMMLRDEPPPVRARGIWNFDDDTYNDSSGNDSNTNPNPWSGSIAIVDDDPMGKVLELSAVAGLEVDHGDALQITDEITIMAWIKPNARWWHTIMSNTPLKSIYWFMAPNMGVNFQPPREWGQNWNTGLAPPQDGSTWTHVAVTYDGSMIRAYMNVDEGYAETAQSGSLSINTGNVLTIGATAGGIWGEGYDGRMDDVRIYHWALSEEEIQEIYDEQAP
jgi:hypothetical protein